jgi:hypothetical protein
MLSDPVGGIVVHLHVGCSYPVVRPGDFELYSGVPVQTHRGMDPFLDSIDLTIFSFTNPGFNPIF